MTTLLDHLATGTTHVCSCWSITRRDGVILGFTDHDRELTFEGMIFSPQSGLSARALASSTGLSIDNTEAVGVLSNAAITETDVNAGRYDGAEVVTWLVRWDDVDARQVRFRGTIGEITRGAGGFQAELHGLTEVLNQPQGRSYLKTCSAILGDDGCRFDTSHASYRYDHTVDVATQGQVFRLPVLTEYNARWFEAGRLDVLTGAAAGLSAIIKSDVGGDDGRDVTLWTPLPAEIAVGDRIRLTAGCDKRAETCREKFKNFINFQGFPDIPGDDWLVSVPRSSETNSGGSLTR